MKALLLPQQRCLLQRVPHGSQPVKELEPSQLVAFCSPSHEAGKATAFLFYREEVSAVYPLGLNLPRRIAKAPTRDDSNMLYCDRLHAAEAATGTAFAAGSSHSWRAHWGSVLKHTPSHAPNWLEVRSTYGGDDGGAPMKPDPIVAKMLKHYQGRKLKLKTVGRE